MKSNFLVKSLSVRAKNRFVIKKKSFSQQELSKTGAFYQVTKKMCPKTEKHLLETQSNDYFTFTVIRHPLDRIVSAYRDRILDGCTGQAKFHVPNIFKRSRKQFLTMGGKSRIFDSDGCVKLFPTFQEFVQYVIATSNKPDLHWVSFNKVCMYYVVMKICKNKIFHLLNSHFHFSIARRV